MKHVAHLDRFEYFQHLERIHAALEVVDANTAILCLDHSWAIAPTRTPDSPQTKAERQALEANLRGLIENDTRAMGRGEAQGEAFRLVATVAGHPQAGAALVNMADICRDSLAEAERVAALLAPPYKERKGNLTPLGQRLLRSAQGVARALGLPPLHRKELDGNDAAWGLEQAIREDREALANGGAGFAALNMLRQHAQEGRIPAMAMAQIDLRLAQGWLERSPLCGERCGACVARMMLDPDRGARMAARLALPINEAIPAPLQTANER